MPSGRTANFIRRLVSPDAAVLAQLHSPDEVTARILRATLEQAQLVGIRRLTMDDVARRSGVGRATLYRRFPAKAALVDAVVLAEAWRYVEGSAEARSGGTTLEDRMVNDTVFTITFLRQHALLRKLLRTEPETILPSLTVDGGALLDFATEQGVAQLRAELFADAEPTPAQQRQLRTVSELQARLTLSFIVTPHTSIDLTSIDETRDYVRKYLLPMMTGLADR